HQSASLPCLLSAHASATTDISPLSLHDALPICRRPPSSAPGRSLRSARPPAGGVAGTPGGPPRCAAAPGRTGSRRTGRRPSPVLRRSGHAALRPAGSRRRGSPDLLPPPLPAPVRDGTLHPPWGLARREPAAGRNRSCLLHHRAVAQLGSADVAVVRPPLGQAVVGQVLQVAAGGHTGNPGALTDFGRRQLLGC